LERLVLELAFTQLEPRLEEPERLRRSLAIERNILAVEIV